jgi:hypothetical protein
MLGRRHKDRRAFGMHWNLSTCIHTHFSTVVIIGPHSPQSAFHPFFYGYEGSCQAQTRKHGDYYAVAHGWSGPSIYRSYAMAWTAQADLKLLVHLSLPGGRQQFKTARRRMLPTRSQAEAHLREAGPPVGSFKPPYMPRYIRKQLESLGIPDLNAHSSWRTLSPPTTMAYTLGKIDVVIPSHPTPETESPSVTRLIDHSSLASSASAVDYERKNYDSREKTLHLVSTSKIYAFPVDPNKSLSETELLSPAWCIDGTTNMRQPVTAPANAPISRHFASYRQQCALQGGEKISRNLISGTQAKRFINAGQRCELFRLILKTYKPVGPRWLWEYDNQWSELHQDKGESIQGVSGRISELETKLSDCGLDQPDIAHKLKLMTCACRGPYHDVFQDVYDKIYVRQESGWDLATLDLETLVNRLTSILRNSHHWGSGTLKPGTYPTSTTKTGTTKTGTSARHVQEESATNWEGSANLTPAQATEVISGHPCFACRANNHHIGICSLVKKCGYTVTYDAAQDTRSAKPQAHRSGTGRPPDPSPAPSPAPFSSTSTGSQTSYSRPFRLRHGTQGRRFIPSIIQGVRQQ